MAGERVSREMAGKTIRDIFKRAEQVADLHGCLTSHRGEHFRFRLLQALERPMDEPAIERLRIESGINEYHRHLNRLVKFGLVRGEEINGKGRYARTTQGENAVDALRRFERRAGMDAALTVYAASLGPNSIRLFLRIYGDQKEVDWNSLQITYTPAEIGRLSVFLPRTIEGISAIDKLNEADLLAYGDDNQIHMQPLRARSFYQYLLELYHVATADRAFTRVGFAAMEEGE